MQIDGGDIILLEMPACPLKAEVIAMTSPSPRELDKGLNVYFFAVARASSCIKCIKNCSARNCRFLPPRFSVADRLKKKR